MISFNRAQPFSVRAHYDLDTPAQLLPPSFDKQLGVYSVGPFTVSGDGVEGGEEGGRGRGKPFMGRTEW